MQADLRGCAKGGLEHEIFSWRLDDIRLTTEIKDQILSDNQSFMIDAQQDSFMLRMTRLAPKTT